MPDLELVGRLEAAAVHAWPATVTCQIDGGWLLRATPGLDRARSNNALTPCRPIELHELAPALERVRSFAREYSITPGIQVSPTFLHDGLQAEVGSHADTVFELLRGGAQFARIGSDAVGIAVEADGLVGTFCVAVDPARRRERLGTAIVCGLLSSSQAKLAYLQVEESNRGARALYNRLGFTETYRYCHRTLPDLAPD
jgi:GNAT superfamily N-acetyltransferase